MNREIKFRAWDGQQMINVCTLEMMIETDGRFIPKSEGWYGENNRKEFSLSDVQLMQFTGLKDAKGKDIYEGDILSHFDKHYIVNWDEKMAAFQSQNPKDPVDVDFFNWGNFPSLQTLLVTDKSWKANCEVIGDVWEHSELLK